jgi:hypothetical protein
LELIKLYFGGIGNITKHGKPVYSIELLRTTGLNHVIIPHFDKYPLITQKRADFILFKQVVDLMKNKKHLTKEGLQQIVNLRASMNLGLSDKLKKAFPDVIPVKRPLVVDQKIKDPY